MWKLPAPPLCLLLLFTLTFSACDAQEAAPLAADLPLGEQLSEDKADGDWGSALTCKPAPDLPRLSRPEITISLHGLTLRLRDRAAGFDKVFAVGVGAIDTKSTSSTYNESFSYFPIRATGKNTFTLWRGAIQPCKTWWTDPETGERSPVFAGLPFMPFYGGYAIHGPIDNFRAPNGGNLRRGFVSHGCIRMEAADVLELYARIRGVASVPVRVQRDAERQPDGARVDVPQRFVGAECASDADCNFAGGFCKANRFGGRGFCTASCTRTCADRAGYPTTFCVADPDDATRGICTLRRVAQMPDCRSLDHFVPVTAARFRQPSVTAPVCVPGAPGWVGDRCFGDGDCKSGTRCARGICTMPCTRFCADQPGWARTFCAAEPSLGTGGSCVRTCTPASNASECPGGSQCVSRTRVGSTTTSYVCIPK